MKTLHRIHLFSLCIYIGGIAGGICLFVLANKLLNIQLPTWLLAFVVLLCLILSATLRISAWRNREKILTSEELNRFGTKVFFSVACFEILVAIIGAGVFLSNM